DRVVEVRRVLGDHDDLRAVRREAALDVLGERPDLLRVGLGDGEVVGQRRDVLLVHAGGQVRLAHALRVLRARHDLVGPGAPHQPPRPEVPRPPPPPPPPFNGGAPRLPPSSPPAVKPDPRAARPAPAACTPYARAWTLGYWPQAASSARAATRANKGRRRI